MEHGKALQLRFLRVTANPEIELFNNPGNEVQPFINAGGAFLHCGTLVGFRDLVLTQS